jgi:hypothetical protein
MPNPQSDSSDLNDPIHAPCPKCAVPMWMVKVEYYVAGTVDPARHIFECKVCDARAVVPRSERVVPAA